MSALSFQAAGLIFCIIGAAILLRAFALASFADLSEHPQHRLETARSMLHTLCGQRIDARVGTPFLIVGFSLQLVAALGVGDKPVAAFLMLSAAAIILLYYSLMRDLIATDAVAAILVEREKAREMPRLLESKVETPVTEVVRETVVVMAEA